MVAYYYDKKDDRLTSLSTYTIPARVQGVTFDASGKVYLSTSYGGMSHRISSATNHS